jgi:hypothetical protein
MQNQVFSVRPLRGRGITPAPADVHHGREKDIMDRVDHQLRLRVPVLHMRDRQRERGG